MYSFIILEKKRSRWRLPRKERNSNYREQGLTALGWFCTGAVEMAVSGTSQEPWKFYPDLTQRMPAGMEEGQGSERAFWDLLFQREGISIKNWDEKSHLTLRSLPAQPIPWLWPKGSTAEPRGSLGWSQCCASPSLPSPGLPQRAGSAHRDSSCTWSCNCSRSVTIPAQTFPILLWMEHF